MTDEVIDTVALITILQYVKNNPKCTFAHNEEFRPEPFKTMKWDVIDNCLFTALKKHYVKGTHTSSGYLFLEITQIGENIIS